MRADNSSSPDRSTTFQPYCFMSRASASVRKSPDVDAYVLAWIASHVPDTRRSPRTLMS
jgi:hypothetical protein